MKISDIAAGEVALSGEPIAAELIATGKFDKAAFDKAHRGERGGDGFILRFAYSLSEKTSAALTDNFYGDARGNLCHEPCPSGVLAGYPANPAIAANPASLEMLRRFATGALSLDTDFFGFAMGRLAGGLARAVPEWTQLIGGQSDLTTATKKSLAMAISKNPEFTAAQRSIMIDSLSGWPVGPGAVSSQRISTAVAQAKADMLKGELHAHVAQSEHGEMQKTETSGSDRGRWPAWPERRSRSRPGSILVRRGLLNGSAGHGAWPITILKCIDGQIPKHQKTKDRRDELDRGDALDAAA